MPSFTMGDFHVHSRQYWRARGWKDSTPQRFNGEAFVHHGAESDVEASHITSWARAAAATREVQNFHMNTRGWSDIAYHYLVFQPRGDMHHATAFMGRPIDHVPAAQLNHNTGTLAICVFGLIDHEDPLRLSTIRLIGALLRHHGTETVGGHRDVTQTDCPGSVLYGHLDDIAKSGHCRRYH